jgi:cobalt-zinc-cadmium efflux system protein
MAVTNQNSWMGFNTFLMPSCFCGVRHSANSNPDRKLQAVRTSLVVVTIFCLGQWMVGHWSGSLTLQADAGHLFSDVFALGITLLAVTLARKPADDRATFGHHRLEIIAAFLNGLSLLGISIWIIHESFSRWQLPQDISSIPMLFGSIVGLLVNGFNLITLTKSGRDDLNLRAVILHIASDFVGSIGALIAGISIHLWHCFWIDTCIGFMVAGLTLLSAIPLIKESLDVLLQYAPKSLNLQEVNEYISDFPNVEKIETLQIWSLTQETTVLCLKIQVKADLDSSDRDHLLRQLKSKLIKNFQIQEVMIEISSSFLPTSFDVHPIFKQSLVDQVLYSP